MVELSSHQKGVSQGRKSLLNTTIYEKI